MDKIFNVLADVECKGFDDKKKLKIAGYANTSNKDRTNDIILPEAWVKGVEAYRKNPVLLYQHDRQKPIGRVTRARVDKGGLYVEAAISSAAEKLHGVQTLVKDGALKSFSVGFRPLKAKYDNKTDTHYITDVELLEVSIVSIPCNSDSLFSIKKSFDNDADLDTFMEDIVENTGYKTASSLLDNNHYHNFEVDDNGNGISTYASNGEKHVHKVVNYIVQQENSHTHVISKWSPIICAKSVETPEIFEEVFINMEDEIEDEVIELETKNIDSEDKTTEIISSDEIEEDLEKPIPFINMLSIETSTIKTDQILHDQFTTYVVKKIATKDDPKFILSMPEDDNKSVELKAKNMLIVNKWDVDTDYDLIFTILTERDFSNDSSRDEVKQKFLELVTCSELELHNFKQSVRSEYQKELNTTINLVSTKNWSVNDYINANKIYTLIEALKRLPKSEQVSEMLMVYGHKNKEIEMATQEVDEPMVVNTSTHTAVVREPEVATLIEKTNEAVLKNVDNEELRGDTSLHETVKELTQQVKKYAEQVNAYNNRKMVYDQDNRRNTTKYSEKEMANAYFLAKTLDKSDPFDTRIGREIKAVTSVDQFLSNFSTTVFEEMQQQLVIARMLNRIPVDAKTFRVPVADEDTDGDVAQFASGTYATGPYDTTRVPTTNQHTMKAVEFTPHKFMSTTHLAKDEQEDTVLPLIDFLRAAAARRIARAIDKSILRGDGSLSGFTASPTNAITVGSGYASVIKGIVTLANDITALRVDCGSSDQAEPADIASARTKLGKYGLSLGDDLVFLTSIEGYNDLVQTSDFRTVDKFGNNATYLTGSIGAIYGIPVVITEFLDNTGASDNQVGCLIYKPGFMIAERRGMEVETEYNPRQQVTATYMSTRFDMKPLTTAGTSSAPTLSTTYSYASVIRSA